MKRRGFIKKTILSTFGFGLLGGVYSWQIEPFWLEFVKKNMAIENLQKNLVGKTVMQISDVHIGNRFDYQYIIKSFKKAQKLAPDFVLYTGDFVTYDSPEQLRQLKDVFKFAVKGKLGTAGVLGNHDYGKNWSQQEVADSITSILKNSGITILSNQEVTINGLNIIGLDDYWGLNFNPKKITNQLDENKANLILCHNPDVCDLPVWNNYKGWILSGHTHGGQIKPPFLKPPILPVKNSKYASGKIDLEDGRTLYINRALGHLWQVRFNVRPEITIFNLSEKVSL
jgi:predicted MPP superfamily phosphohydrolase